MHQYQLPSLLGHEILVSRGMYPGVRFTFGEKRCGLEVCCFALLRSVNKVNSKQYN